MLDGSFVTITGFKNYDGRKPFSIGTILLCQKEPENPYDSEAIRVWSQNRSMVGYLANSVSTKANGTMSAGRIYDQVGDYFFIEVCFSTESKIICQITDFHVENRCVLQRFIGFATSDDDEEIAF